MYKKIRLVLICVCVLVVVGIGAYVLGRTTPHGTVQAENEEEQGIVTESIEISGETIRAGMRDIGELATEEYWFTQVQTFDSTKSAQLFNITFDIPLTHTRFIYSYDGVIKAGIDFTQAEVEKDDLKRLITVKLPKAYILSSEIDYDSFELYDEQNSIFNPISVKDVSDTNREMLRAAEKDAIAKGVLNRADKNAEELVKNFLRGGYDVLQYAIKIEHAQ